MRVLYIYKPNSYINQLAAEMNKWDESFLPSVVWDKSKDLENIISIYEQVIYPKFTLKSVLFLLRNLHKIALYSYYSAVLLFINLKQGIKSANAVMQATLFLSKIQHHNLASFDHLHFHFPNILRAICIMLSPKKSNIIMTFWGSDIFRTSGLTYHFWMQKALKRANVINMSSNEMREALSSEFGREIDQKLKYSIFFPKSGLIDQINNISQEPEQLSNFEKKYGLENNLPTIIIGTNGYEQNNHLQILRAIKNFSKKQKLNIILPLTYGLSPSYLKQIKEITSDINSNTILLQDYLSWEELAAMRLVADLYISMPTTDAMSATVMESLYAENVCIVGSWLPYSTFRASGAYYLECETFDKLPEMLSEIIANIDEYKGKCAKNKELVKARFFNTQQLSAKWKHVYQKD